ncbi:MAG: hypothetical protein HUU49_00815 [Candidatus Buchananbacteria bacterium]|nr:hypothetical protein [Candidatus Buchananbacteria bacterium]
MNICLVLGGLSLGLWLANVNIPYYGSLIIKLDQVKDQPMLSRLGPDVRISFNSDSFDILESPVYFDLRSMPWFSKALVYLTFRSKGDDLEGVAPQVGPDWQYHLQPPVTVIDLENDWHKAVFEFDLRKVYQEKNIRRFLVSTIHQPGGSLEVSDLTIILQQ